MFFSSNDSTSMNLKTFVIPTNEKIADTLRSLWSIGETNNGEEGVMSLRSRSLGRSNLSFHTESRKLKADSLLVLDDPIESNKRHIISGDSIIGYAYVIHEQIACPSCSDINYLLITDTNYTIKHIISLHDIVEDYKIISINKLRKYSNQFIGLRLLGSDFTSIKEISEAKKYSHYFINSILSIQKKFKLLYEK